MSDFDVMAISTVIAGAMELFVVTRENNGVAYVLSSVYKWVIILAMLFELI